MGIVTAVFIIVFAILFPFGITSNPQFPPSPLLVAALVFAYLSALSVLFIYTPLVFFAWFKSWRSVASRVLATLFVAGGVIIVGLMILWNIIFARI